MTQVSISELIAGVVSGCVVSFPTDTVPALAVLPENSELLFEVKQRSQDKPLILMGVDDSLWQFVNGSLAEIRLWQQIAAQYWPGALTLVLPASERVPRAMNPNDPSTIGLRVPACAIAQTILVQTGALATTSANLSGQPSLQTMTEIAQQFPEVLTLRSQDVTTITPGGVPSTVAKWNGSGWDILRQGAVKLEF